ncbi:FhaA domain-containing protein [Streptomyces sp. NPDC048383]|uniref:FhaA domain-containing protein n=1 Tax=Streptomyces sp. NPDC048383 TaxID=3155386 RepID=UPI00342D818E
MPSSVYAEIGPHLTVVGQELTDRLERHGERESYEWAGPLTVRLAAAERVPNGGYKVHCAPMAHITSAPLTALNAQPEGPTAPMAALCHLCRPRVQGRRPHLDHRTLTCPAADISPCRTGTRHGAAPKQASA